jgi:hypothetical protein
MAYARVEESWGDWYGLNPRRRARARFFRRQLGQIWMLDVKDDDLVTAAQAALLLRVHEQTVRGWVSTTRVPAYMYTIDGSNTIMFKLSDVHALWVAAGCPPLPR